MKKIALLLSLMSLSVHAFSWSNGGDSGNGFGTHDWILKEAIDDLDNCGHWLYLDAALQATDDPDTEFRDFYYHVYDRWGSQYGNAPYKIQYYYNQAVAYLKSYDYYNASIAVGRMAHYYADIWNPMHTDQNDLESSIHSSYETKINTYTDRVDEAVFTVYDYGETYISNVTQFSIESASESHVYYDSLVNEYYNNGYTNNVKNWTATLLNKAGNGLQDLIYSIEQDAF